MSQKIDFDDIEGNDIKYDEERLGVPILYGIGWLMTFVGQSTIGGVILFLATIVHIYFAVSKAHAPKTTELMPDLAPRQDR